MNANEKTWRLGMPLLAHGCLLVLLVADTYRRGSEGMVFVALSAVCLVTCLVGVLYFIANPRAFFFLESRPASAALPTLAMRLLAWPVVVLVPIVWLLLTQWLKGAIETDAVLRCIMAYAFFTWIIGAMLLSPWLFGRRK